MTPKTIEELEERIDEIAGRYLRPRSYDHNLLAITLSDVAKRFGMAKANALVREYDLDARFGIQEAKDDAATKVV